MKRDERAARRRRCAHGLISACAVAMLAFAQAEAALAEPPDVWRSYPLNQTGGNVSAQAEQDACDFESRQAQGGPRALLIFLLGRANQKGRTYGVGPESDFLSNKDVARVLENAARAYNRCRGSKDKKVDIAYGVTNYKLSTEVRSQGNAMRAGQAQGGVAQDLTRRFPSGVGAVAAGDIEPGWDPEGSGYALDLVRGAANQPGQYFNFGTAGHCKPFGDGCQGNWTLLDIGRVSQDFGVLPLPQIYYPKQAETWEQVAKAWDKAPRNCSNERERDCYSFGGVTAHPTGCHGVEFTPKQSWRKLNAATKRPVGRRLILFNPRKVSCRSTPEASRRDAGPYDLPLMPELVAGEIVDDPDPITSEYGMARSVNAWRAGNHRELTWVHAGAAGVGPAAEVLSRTGRLVITRETYYRDRPMERTVETVDVAGAGALRIVGAPTGRRAARAAPSAGSILFEGESGMSGVLDLATGAVAAG